MFCACARACVCMLVQLILKMLCSFRKLSFRRNTFRAVTNKSHSRGIDSLTFSPNAVVSYGLSFCPNIGTTFKRIFHYKHTMDTMDAFCYNFWAK